MYQQIQLKIPKSIVHMVETHDKIKEGTSEDKLFVMIPKISDFTYITLGYRLPTLMMIKDKFGGIVHTTSDYIIPSEARALAQYFGAVGHTG